MEGCSWQGAYSGRASSGRVPFQRGFLLWMVDRYRTPFAPCRSKRTASVVTSGHSSRTIWKVSSECLRIGGGQAQQDALAFWRQHGTAWAA